MDYLIDGIIIVFVLSCIVFFYNALKIQHGSKNFPTPKDDPPKVDQKAISDVNYEDVNYQRAKKDKLERDLKAWKKLGT